MATTETAQRDGRDWREAMETTRRARPAEDAAPDLPLEGVGGRPPTPSSGVLVRGRPCWG
ncbi:hypothetical protein ABZW30_33970 [Kitasatospora sp. NPDC004669]|uniref:hypothetical protein n=1 Tax=Kitasatospora sp. NPDC004669 TaxID=3154555 RepID=UPI0033A0E23D